MLELTRIIYGALMVRFESNELSDVFLAKDGRFRLVIPVELEQ
jgi:hypothetical protein